ncbi:triosephosphate isomerase [Arthrobacter sp. KBS0703]|uniref:triose-phosphate isomerase family protein n=1 Tax=Arthrobacter sp. KBS0703 TaxID=1955698 RepID=UPI00098F1678|nr:triose-phosphate isomerase family protein [Arthrobacter sp. KBS0703]TSE14237.1 triosephosphate isomerase [Arthrobacter sp. KBS0703]TSE17740.1 triosephosphate isomerase [Arthrobacter sp. KBS0703]
MSLPANTAAGGTGAAVTTGPKAIIGVSLKMYFGYQRSVDYCREVATIALAHPAVQSGDIELFVLPILPVLPEAARILGAAGAAAGAQDIFWEDQGAFTGEVGGAAVAELGGRYAEIGHAERRRIFGEDDRIIGLKTAAAYRNGLTPVLCVGELQQGSVEEAITRCTAEIDGALNRAQSLGPARRTIVAYEPQWAIGAPEPATPQYISAVIAGLDAHLRALPGQAESRVIYGGSAGPGLISQLDMSVAGLFLGRFAHNPAALREILDETAERLGLLEPAGGRA